MAAPRVLTLPGLCSSGPTHWQSRWERRYGYARVEQDDWDRPERDAWLMKLEAAVQAQPSAPILVAHSLGCALVAHYAARMRPGQIAGALLVAPADVDDPARTPDETRCFSPLVLQALGFPAIVVASHDDPFIAFGRAGELATRWQARFVDAGNIGHINADSGLGDWDFGHGLLEELRASIRP
jgi:predicted alpha/beta hydrolase family esterase